MIYYHSIIEYLLCPTNPLCATYSFLFPSQPLTTMGVFTVPIVLPLPEYHMFAIIKFIAFINFLIMIYKLSLKTHFDTAVI